MAEIWRDQPPQRGLMQPVTAGILEQFVFSKPYFDPDGLIVALSDERARRLRACRLRCERRANG